MSSPDVDNFSQRMSEAALLPPDDPHRQQVAREVAAAGPDAAKRWLDLLREDEELRLALGRVAVPQTLDQRLLTVPDAIQPRRALLPRYLHWAMAAAAVLLLAVAGVWFALQSRSSGQMSTLALLAINDHVNRPPLLIQSSDAAAIEQALKGRVPFAVEVYKAPAGMTLAGGGTCFLGSHPAAFMRYEKDGRTCTLFQVTSASVGLPRSYRRAIEVPDQRWAGSRGYRAAIWADPDIACTWVFVVEGDEPRDLFVFPT